MKMTLTAVCDFQGGTQPPKNEWIDHEANGYVRMLQIRDFTQSEKDNIEYVKDTKNLKKCNENDILIGRYGASVGKILTGLSGAYNVAIVKAIPDTEKIFARYLYYFFTSPYFQNFIKSVGSRAAQTGFNKDDLKNAVIPLISTDEQRKIAAVLDKVSDLIAKRRQQLDKLDELIKARFVEMFGDMVNNPKAWDTYSLDDCFEITSSKRILKSEWKDSGIPFLRVRDMVQLATTGKVDNEFFISEEFYASLSDSDGIPKEGDILVSATSTLGKCYVVGKGERFYFKDADVLRLRAKKEINPIFFIEQMKTGYIEEQISKTLGVTTVAHFTIKAAKIINMRCPNIELQNQFAAFVEQTEKTKTTISESLQQLETLKKALMQEYFG